MKFMPPEHLQREKNYWAKNENNCRNSSEAYQISPAIFPIFWIRGEVEKKHMKILNGESRNIALSKTMLFHSIESEIYVW